jgi:hypothetical protein
MASGSSGIEGDGRRSAADCGTKIHVAGTVGRKRSVKADVWLDVHAVPALLIKMLRNTVFHRVASTYIHVEAGHTIKKNAAQNHVLGILSIGKHRRQHLTSLDADHTIWLIFPGCHALVDR